MQATQPLPDGPTSFNPIPVAVMHGPVSRVSAEGDDDLATTQELPSPKKNSPSPTAKGEDPSLSQMLSQTMTIPPIPKSFQGEKGIHNTPPTAENPEPTKPIIKDPRMAALLDTSRVVGSLKPTGTINLISSEKPPE